MKILDSIKKYSETDRTALVCNGEKMSYRELDFYSEKLGFKLISMHDDDTPLLVYGGKDNFVMVSMMAALKSGRAYVPIDLSFPADRTFNIVYEVRPKVIVNAGDIDLKETLKEVNNLRISENGESLEKEYLESLTVIDKAEIVEEFAKEFEDVLSGKKTLERIDESIHVKGDENAYILFTSGSTGKPKGVQISSNNIDSFENWMSPVLGFNGDEKVVMNQPAYSFDLSVSQVYPGLSNGATLWAIGKDVVADFKLLFSNLENSKMEVWVSTPSFAGMCLAEKSFNQEMLENLRAFLFIGEVLPKKTAKALLERFPKAKVINGYGPTEATVGVSEVSITMEMTEKDEALPVGKPMPNHKIFVIDENGKELPEGEKGEIVIAGPSVSKGYFRDKIKTEKSFFEIEENGVKIPAYRTGDLGTIVDNMIHYSGRVDFQIKLNGYRIEIEDIENNLRKVDNVKNAIIVPVYRDEKISYLKGIVELEEKNDLTNMQNSKIIKRELANLLPDYMIPRNIKVIDEFPVNTNGKIDRKKFLEDK